MAFIYGSIARGGKHAASDLDVMVVSNTLTYTQIIERLLPAEESLGRKINPTLYSEKEFSDRLEKKQAFLIKVLQQQILWLTGEKFYLKKYASK